LENVNKVDVRIDPSTTFLAKARGVEKTPLSGSLVDEPGCVKASCAVRNGCITSTYFPEFGGLR
jgi:hypothetical protein